MNISLLFGVIDMQMENELLAYPITPIVFMQSHNLSFTYRLNMCGLNIQSLKFWEELALGFTWIMLKFVDFDLRIVLPS